MRIAKSLSILMTGLALAAGSSAIAAGNAPQPGICTRACWGASAGSTSYMSALTRAIIHHTAGSEYNTSGLEASKTNVRAIQNLHKSYGWGDIGYHFLVDKYGNIFEGRINSWSGLPRGTHDGTNTNSFGFNLMGYYHPSVNNIPTQASLNALYAVIAWRMPNGWTPYGSPGVYGPNGLNVGRLDSHRRVNATACPGDHLHNPYIGNDVNSGVMRAEVAARINGAPPPPPPPPAARPTGTHFLRPDGRLVSFGVFADGTVNANGQIAPGGAWQGWGTISPGTGFKMVDAVQPPNDAFVVFGVGNGTQVSVNWQDVAGGGWAGWNPLGGGVPFNFVQCQRYNDGRYAAFACGNGTEIWSNAQVAAGGGWGGWGVIAPGSGFKNFSIIKRPDDTFVCFAIGDNTPVSVCWQNAVSGPMVPWQSLGGPGFKQIRSVLRPDGACVLFGVGNGTEVWATGQVEPYGGWQAWGMISSGTGFTSIDPVLRPNGSFTILGVGNGTQVSVNWQDVAYGGWSGWAGLGNSPMTSCDAVLAPNNSLRVFAHGANTPEYVNWQDVAYGGWAGWANLGGTLQ